MINPNIADRIRDALTADTQSNFDDAILELDDYAIANRRYRPILHDIIRTLAALHDIDC